MSEYHTPVLLTESVSALVTNPDGCYVDATYGGGGHTAEILSRLSGRGRVLAFDRDSDALRNRIADPRLTLVHNNFRFIGNFLAWQAYKDGAKVPPKAEADGILADLGVSSHQFDTAERGFSFRYDAPLDMRMNRQASFTAADLLNRYSREELERVLGRYGEVEKAGVLSRLLCEAREKHPLLTTGDLAAALAPVLPKFAAHKYLAKVYQALRIEVNGELDALEKLLAAAAGALRTGGRLVVITYHSLEDRLVKNFMKAGNAEGRVEKDFYGHPLSPFRVLGGKPVTPAEAEIAANTRARSARLRVAEKIGEGRP